LLSTSLTVIASGHTPELLANIGFYSYYFAKKKASLRELAPRTERQAMALTCWTAALAATKLQPW
jgi:hypothetical protein